MAMKRCPVCGEKYSDTYRDCPFCEEEEALSQGDRIRRSGRGGRRVARRQQPNLLSPILIVLILLMACLLVYLLFGDKIAEKLGKGEEPATPPASEEVQPKPPVVDGTPDDSPEDPENTPEPVPETVELNYEQASQLPAGLTLSTTDFSLFTAGETHTITASGGNGSYQWFSQDEGVASVDDNGTVTAISKGDINIVVTDGEKQGTCIVRVRASGTSTPTATAPAGGTQSGSLTAGPAKVINGGNGVRVRSGPGTNYEVLASVPNGGSVQIVESAGDGWYKITFAGGGGTTTTGYMKGDYLKND